MKMGIGIPIPELSNLPGASRPGGGDGPESAFMYKTAVTSGVQTDTGIYQIVLSGSGGNMTIDWGDGATTTLTPGTNRHILHTYNDGTNTAVENPIVKIGLPGETGIMTQFFYQAGTTLFASELLEIQQWGTKHLFSAFNVMDATQVQLTAEDTPNVTGGGLEFAFEGCSAFTGNSSMNSWDTSNITSLKRTFFQCSNFNQDLYNWDTSNVTNFTSAFYENVRFNGNINGWDFTSGTGLTYFLYRARQFNQPVNNWNLGGALKVATFMMEDANSFNQDISAWDVSKITNASHMLDATKVVTGLSSWQFTNATTLYRMLFTQTRFNEDIGNMGLGANLTDMRFMLYGATALSNSNWTSSVVGWANQVFNNSGPYNVNAGNIATAASLTFDNAAGGGSNFADAGAARDYLAGATAGWTITGDTRIN